ncbi:MAG: hypothetical protein PWP71_2727 [Clostridia bacterium]|jgi:drug/metabolite transporter (DMT)-like permease|nr:hypothetical protein [Clostridia bacterium]
MKEGPRMKLSPNILLLLAPLFWSLNFLIGKTLAGVIPAGALTFLRWSISLSILLPFCWKELFINKKLFLSNWPLILTFGLTGYFLNSVGTFLAVSYTSAINAAFIASFNPVVFALIAFFFYREKVSLVQITGIITSLTGVLWIIFKGNLNYILHLKVNLGDGFMLLAVLSWAVYSNILKKKGKIFPWTSLFAVMIMGGIVVTTPYLITETLYSGWGWINDLNFRHYISILAVGIFPSLLAFYCWNKAIEMVESNQAAIFLNLIPVYTTILSIIILGEEFMLYHIIGGILIFLGVFMVTNYQTLTKSLKEKFSTGI